MSFDLYVFPSPGPATAQEVYRLMEQDEARAEAGEREPDPSRDIAAFLAQLERDWGRLQNEDPDRAPWASWPLWQPVGGGGTALNIVWSRAEAMRRAVIEAAGRHRLTVFDPQEELVIPPAQAPRWRRWRRT